MKYSNIGGQAVMEGVMMRNGGRYAVAVRTIDGQIAVKAEDYKPVLPIRGRGEDPDSERCGELYRFAGAGYVDPYVFG